MEKQCISRGQYRHPQVAGLISVRDYIFLKQDDRKCLLLRFFNEMDYEVYFFSFTLIQLDAMGTVIKKSKIKRDAILAHAGMQYYDQKGILVDEFCTDFRIVLHEVRSSNYRYLVSNGHVSVCYIKDERPLEYGNRTEKTDQGFSVHSKSFGNPRLVRFLVTLAVLFMALFAIYTTFRDYLEVERHASRKLGAERAVIELSGELLQDPFCKTQTTDRA